MEELEKAINRYKSVAETANVETLLKMKDYFIGMLYYHGQMEADWSKVSQGLEMEYDKIKSETFVFLRKSGTTEKMADQEARLAAVEKHYEVISALHEYKTHRSAKETISKIIDAISQRVSIIRREGEFNQFIK
jgi:hypothetical protein